MSDLKTSVFTVILASSLSLAPILDAHARKKSSSRSSSFSFSTSKSYSKPSWRSSSSTKSSASSSWGSSKSSYKTTSVTSTEKSTTSSQSKSGWGGSSSSSTATKPGTSSASSSHSTGSKAASTQSKSGWGGKSTSSSGAKSTGSKTNSTVKATSSAKSTQLAAKPNKKISQQKQADAFKRYKSEQQKFSRTPSTVGDLNGLKKKSPLYSQVAGKSNKRSDYWERRDKHYGSWKAPAHVYKGKSRYGLFDGLFLGFMLGSILTPDFSAFAYHHEDDPGMQEWLGDMEVLAQNDAELRQQLDILNTQVEKMRGAEKDPGYLPEGLSADIVMAPDVVMAGPSFRYCTGGKSGNYFLHGQLLETAAANQLNVELINTAGTIDNLGRMERNECDGALAQRTGFQAYAEQNPNGHFNFERVATPALEYAHMVCNKNSGVESVKGLKNKTLLIGDKESGTAQTWMDFVKTDAGYREVNTQYAGGFKALNKVYLGTADCMMYVASLNTELMKKANELGNKLALVPVNDWDFNNSEYAETETANQLEGMKDQSGEDMYMFDSIPNEQYPNIQSGFFSSSVKTLSVPMDMVVSLDWSEKNPDAYEKLMELLIQTQHAFDKAIQPN